MSNPAFWADVVVVLHVAYVAVVVVGQLLILVGAVLRRRWIRNFWFRVIHLAMMVVVALEAGFGMQCPLTTLERDLRSQAGQVAPETFTGWLFHNVLFFEGVDPAIFPILHISFGVLVVLTFVLAPPRWPFGAPSAKCTAA